MCIRDEFDTRQGFLRRRSEICSVMQQSFRFSNKCLSVWQVLVSKLCFEDHSAMTPPQESVHHGGISRRRSQNRYCDG